MRILMISSFLPFPLTSGGHIRLYNLIKELSNRHEVTLVCEKRNVQTEKDIQEVKKLCKEVFVVERKKQWSIKNIVKTGFSLYPFLLVGHRSKDMKKILADELAKNTFDVIHIETFYVMQNLPETSLPVVLVEHNIEYLVYRRYAGVAPFLFSLFLYVDVFKLWYWEHYFWKKANRLVAVSEIEKKLMKQENVSVVPNGVDLQQFPYKPKKPEDEKRVLFLGDFKWIQNRESMKWILKEVWPILSQKKYIVLWIVGSNIPEEFKREASKTICIEENSPLSTQEILQRSDVMVSPVRVGGGTSYKILESMATGVPVVTTSLGAQGLGAKNLEEMMVRDDPLAFAQSVERVLEDVAVRNKIIKNARKLIEEKHDWKIISKQLEEVYRLAIV